MFIKLTHGLHAVLNAIVSYIQKWTDDSVPDGTRTLHNFKDGQGKRPAVPLDELSNGNNIVNVKTDSKFEHGADNVTNSENVLKVELKTELAYGSDNIASKTGIENTVCVPEPIIFEISNEVPDKIEKVIPIKTQALPGQDFIFQILYVKDYSYIEGDILPVFGNWGNYARLSTDGKYLTVNSNADLSVRLILTPAPQDWIPEKPDPSIIQQAGDRMLNTIPRDGSKYEYTVEEMKLENNFYNVTIENEASTFVTNFEFENDKHYNVDATLNKITIPMTFAEGFDENSIYWKCYDDPKSAEPAIGYFIEDDLNEEFGPLPDGYRKLQYISPKNNAYIDLGIKLKKDYKVKILMNITGITGGSYAGLFGARNSKDTDYWSDNHTNGAYALYSRYNYNNIGYQRGSNRYMFYQDEANLYNKLNWYYATGTTFEVQSYDGTVIRKLTATENNNIDTEWNCYLFAVNDMGSPYINKTVGIFYRLEIWDENDNIIMRLIPAKNLFSGTIGAYDIINNQFYCSAEPMGYFEGPEFYVYQKQMQCSDHNAIMYLENNNDIDYNADYEVPEGYEKLYEIYSKERRLDTGYRIKKDDRVECCATVDNNTNSSYRVLFGSRQSSFSDDNYFFFTRFNGSNIACYGKNAKETRGTTMTYNKPCKFVAEPYSLSCYNSQNELEWKIDVDGGTPVDCRYNCWLGCGNSNGSIDSWCYAHYHYFRVYDKDDNLVVNMIPAKRISDGVLGFYDTIRNTFYTSNSGNYNYESKSIHKGEKRLLYIENINDDINLGINRNPVYDNPFKLEDCIEDEHQNEPIDSLVYNYELTDTKILDYFYIVSTVNEATDYVTTEKEYATGKVNEDITMTLTYKSGYDNYDLTCTPDTTATVVVNRPHYITHNELEIPAEYTSINGIFTNNGNTYFKTGYIPEWDDKVVCYCSILRDSYYTYPCYVFGARTAVNNKSFVFYAHRTGNDNRYRMAYDRYCGETDIDEIKNNELMKITEDNNSCECDYAYTKIKITNTTPTNIKYDYQDYNSDVVLPNNYEKLSCIIKNQNSNAYFDLGLVIKPNYKVETIVRTKRTTTKPNVVIFGSSSKENMFIAEQTSTVFTYPMIYDEINNYWKNTNQNKNSTNSELEFKILKECSLLLNVTQSSEASYDYLIILKNGVQITNTAGLNGARTISVPDLLENDVIKIYYRKDGSASSGSDTATVQIICNGIIVKQDFIAGIYKKTNILYTRYTGNNVIALKQEELYTNSNYIYDDTIKIKMDGSKISWRKSNDELIAEMPYSSSSENPIYNTYLLGINVNDSYELNDGNEKTCIYSFKLYDENDNLIYNLIPAQKKNNNECGLYDIVTDTFFTNAGEDRFYGHHITNVYYGGEDCEYEMYLFGCNNANSKQYSYYGNMYKFTIYNGDGQATVNLVPVKRVSDNTLGFYDTIRRTFITPANGVVTESTEPIYKSSMVVSNVPSDTTVTITKNNNARKNISLEDGIEDDVNHQNIDQLETNYELKNTEIVDWFNTVKYINNAESHCKLDGDIATYYNTPLIGDNTRFPVTYDYNLDNNMIEAEATNGATVTITEPMKIVYDNVPDEYIKLYGIRNSDYKAYFEIPYQIKATDTIKLWVNDEKYSYAWYIFGTGTSTTQNSCILCSRYENSNTNMYYSRNQRINITGPANEVLEITCEPSNINYTNGYDNYDYDLENTSTDCPDKFHLFGALTGTYHNSSFRGTIYKFIIYDNNGVKINLLPVLRKVDNAIGFYDTIQDKFYLPIYPEYMAPAQMPKLKGKIIVDNITEDTDLIVTEKSQPSLEESTGEVITSYSLESCAITDYWHWININNTTNGDITFNNMVYDTCYTCLHEGNITLPCSYKSGRSSTDFIVSDGTLTNNGIVLSNVKEDKNITVMLNDYHDPKSDTNDDLNIFTNPDFSSFNQYRIVEGTDLMLSSYSFINSQIASMANRDVFEFNITDIDLLSFNPANIPGNRVKAKIVTTDSNLLEVVQNVTIGGKQMYKHTITLRNQIKLETGKTYLFKVRDNTDTGKLIAYAKDTGPLNLVNSNGEYVIEDTDIYFNWNEANKYIVQGNKNIYFELNGIKL